RSGELHRVGSGNAGRRAQLRRQAQMIAGKVDDADAAAAREHRLVSFGEFDIAGAIGNDQHLQQRERGCHDLEFARVCGSEQRGNGRKEGLVFLDEIDEDRRVDADRGLHYAGQSPTTWPANLPKRIVDPGHSTRQAALADSPEPNATANVDSSSIVRLPPYN